MIASRAYTSRSRGPHQLPAELPRAQAAPHAGGRLLGFEKPGDIISVKVDRSAAASPILLRAVGMEARRSAPSSADVDRMSRPPLY